jgi:hypothetical protein
VGNRYDFAMETRLQRVLQNRWFAAIATFAIGYIAVRTLLFVAEDAYYVYEVYPKEKGAEYSYPELRYTFGQIAIFLWSLVGLCTAVLTARSAFFCREHKWAARSLLAFALGFVLLVLGFIGGMAMRDFGP